MILNGENNLFTGFSPYLQANKDYQDQKARLINSQSKYFPSNESSYIYILGKLEVPKQVKTSVIGSPVLKVEGQGREKEPSCFTVH